MFCFIAMPRNLVFVGKPTQILPDLQFDRPEIWYARGVNGGA
jgi:hypothetical protein